MRLFSSIYHGLLWGLLLAVLISNNFWLDMRIRYDLVIPAAVLLTLIIGFMTKSKVLMTARFTLVNLFLCSLLTLLLLGRARLAVMPAAIIRETINMTGVSFAAINLVLIIFLILGLILIWIRGVKAN